jgi:pilus assembly protein Flp/PilA
MIYGIKAGVRPMEKIARSLVSRFLRDESGATAIEYALIASATGFALIAVMPTIGQALGIKFAAVAVGLN